MADHATSDDSPDLSGEDLDAFLVLLESRLRADFTSPDLSRIIASQGTVARGGGAPLTTLPSGNPSSPAKFLQLVRQVFGRAGKPIKLRSLLSLLGLDSDGIVEREARNKGGGSSSFGAHHMQQLNEGARLEGRKTDDVAWKLLREAESNSAELWVRVVAGIVRGKMFEGPTGAEGGATDASTEAERQLEKIVAEILGNTRQAISAADERREEAKQQLSNDEAANGQTERTLEALRIGQDLCPTYAPFRYALLAPESVTALVPEADTNADFAANMDAEILGVDAEVERRRAEEEGKELRTAAAGVSGGAMARGTAAGRGPGGANPLGGRAPGAILAGRTRGRFSNAGGRGAGGRGAGSGGASLFRPSSSVGRGAGRGGLAGRGVAGRAGRAGRSAPLQRRAPGAARALLSASGRGAASGSGGGESSKMKMIDASEAEGLARARQEKEAMANLGSVEARKLERKRKLMEDAKASGLRNGREKRSRPVAASGAAAGAADGKSAGPGASDVATNKADAPAVPQRESATAPAASEPTSVGQPATEQLDSLLDKSNKLSPAARQSVAAFFRHRASSDRNKPLALPEGADPSTGVWKVKLNEEKTVDPATGESVKETLYLELNYRVLGFKKTRKVKRK